MKNINNGNKHKRYTIATRNIDLQDLIIAGIMIVLMIIWACLITDKRFIFIPLFFLAVLIGIFISCLFRYITEPKIAIQADCNGIYFYYRNKKEVFIDYNNIVEIIPMGKGYISVNSYGQILIKTENDKYLSIRTLEGGYKLRGLIKDLLSVKNKEEYLMKNEIKTKSKIQK